jgi:hypothetical protein
MPVYVSRSGIQTANLMIFTSHTRSAVAHATPRRIMMTKFKVSYWTIIEADNRDEAKKIFIQDIDEESIDVEVVEDD